MKSLCHSRHQTSLDKLKTLVVSITLLFFFSFTSYALNPGKIEGIVSDAESYATIPAAKVELLNTADSSVVKIVLTNNDGKYVIDDVPFGKYLLRISGMTYRKQIVSDVDITPEKPALKFGATNLLPESKMLKEVGVYAYKLTGQMEDDKTIYTIKDKSAEISQSGLDLLRQLPDINVDFRTNEVTLAGSNNILFQVNGKKVDRTYLMQLNPKLIEKVEIITNPGVKYDADVDAVINIILKKNMSFGLSGRVSVEMPTSKYHFTNNNASIDYFTKGMRFYVSAWGGGEKWDVAIHSERINRTGNTRFTQDNQGMSKNVYGGFNYGFDWFINDNNMFNFYSSLSPRMPNSDDFVSDNLFANSTETTHSQATTTGSSKNFSNDYSLYYKHKFAKKDHEISFESYCSTNQNGNKNEYKELLYNQADSITNTIKDQWIQSTDNNKWQISFKTDYTYPITEKLKLSAGYNANLNRITNTVKSEYGELHDTINYNEDRHSAYSNLAWNAGNFNFQSGVRFESSFLHIDHHGKTTGDYHCFLPFASVQYKLGKKQTFRLNYRKSIRRPGMDQLSPFAVKDDAYTLTTGNSDLSPAYIHKFEFTHRIQLMGPMFVSYRPYINFITNGIQQVNLSVNDSVIQKKYINVNNELEYGVVISGTLAFVKWWSISPSYTLLKKEIKAFPEYGILSQKRTSWRIGISSQFILPKDWVVFVEYNYSSPVITQQSTNKRNFQFVTGFYKPINKKLNITVFTLNPGYHQFIFSESTINTETMTQHTTSAVKYNWIVNIRIGFNFNKGKEGKKVDRQVETDSEAGGKKGVM